MREKRGPTSRLRSVSHTCPIAKRPVLEHKSALPPAIHHPPNFPSLPAREEAPRGRDGPRQVKIDILKLSCRAFMLIDFFRSYLMSTGPPPMPSHPRTHAPPHNPCPPPQPMPPPQARPTQKKLTLWPPRMIEILALHI